MSQSKAIYRIEGRDPTIFRVIKNKLNPYVMVDRRMPTNPALSFKAKGILTYLLTRPDGWEVNIPDLVNHSTDGKAAIRTGLKELRNAKYVRYNPMREGGYIKKWVIEVYEIPYPEYHQSQITQQSPFSEEEVDKSLESDFDILGEPLESDSLHVENLEVENRMQLSNESSNKGIKDSIKRGARKTPRTTPSKTKRDYFKKEFQALANVFIKRSGLKCHDETEITFWENGSKTKNAKGFRQMVADGITPESLGKAFDYIEAHNRKPANRSNLITIKSPNSIYSFAIQQRGTQAEQVKPIDDNDEVF